MYLVINGQSREFPQLTPGAQVRDLIAELGLKGDRLAIEQNGNIVPRSEWGNTALGEGDKLEIVHFVGGGSAKNISRKRHPHRDPSTSLPRISCGRWWR
jgi:sulfur carrier protein